MSILVSLCLLKIEIVHDMSNETGKCRDYRVEINFIIFPLFCFCCFVLDSSAQGAVSSEHPTNPRLVKELRGKREPKAIQIETYANVVMSEDSESVDKGVLPKSSREQTPLDEIQPIPEVPGEINFFSGNPFVEKTTGILHLFKKK